MKRLDSIAMHNYSNPSYIEVKTKAINNYQDKSSSTINLKIEDNNMMVEISTELNYHYNRADSFYQEKSYSNCITENNLCIALDSNFSIAYQNIGLCYLAMKNYLLAKNYFSIQLAQQPYIYLGYYNRGLANFYLANYQSSINDMDSAITKSSDYKNALYMRAVCYYKLKNYTKSIYELNSLLKIMNDYDLHNKSMDVYSYLGLCYWDMKESSKACIQWKNGASFDSKTCMNNLSKLCK